MNSLKRILLIEDTDSDAALVTHYLRRLPGGAKPELVWVTTLAEAVARLERDDYDCVLLDLNLPDGNGLENVQRIRAAARNVAIVVLTGNDDGQTALAALRCGAQEYLVKGSYDDGRLPQVIRHAVERHRVLVDLDRQRQRDIFMAGHDPLTGLINRQLLAERAQEIIAQCERRGESFALCFLDLDGFKPINDRLGHAVGDAALKEVAATLSSAGRASDTVARVGGDEFVVLLSPVSGIAEAETAALRLVQRIGSIRVVDGHAVNIGASAGLAMYPNHGLTLDQLFLKADKAMYAAKESGRGSLKVSAENPAAGRDVAVAGAPLVDDANLALLFQPWVDQGSGAFGGVEALLRQRLGGDLVPPDGLLRAALEHGLLGDLCQWVVRRASAAWKSWHDAGLPVGRLAINLSRAEISRQDLPGLVLGILDSTGMPARFLQLELPEDAFDALSPEALDNIRTLRAHGVQMLMDNFGRHLAGLRLLLSMPIDGIKIDRSLIHILRAAKPAERALVAGILGVARAQGLAVIATGVEQEAELLECQSLGFRYFQGTRLQPPLASRQLQAVLAPAAAGARRLELVRKGKE
ncbi:MAG: EAL domain-containing protein [Nevskia sp.]|nr:EAL domain-containing protein [Nevskia sp.]